MFKMLKVVLFLAFTQICAAENDIPFSVFTVTSKSITVQWTPMSAANSYQVTATPVNSSKSPVFVQFSGNTVMASLNQMSPNTLYSLQLQAYDSALTVIGSTTIQETTAPAVPSVLQAYSKLSNSITVEFTEVAGATGYILRAEAGDFFLETEVASSPGTVVLLQPYTSYTMSVISLNQERRSQPSYPVQAKTVVTAPQLQASSPSNSSILVTWPAVEHAVLYELSIIRQGSAARHKVNVTNTTMTFNNLEAGTTYCIQGTAYDVDGRPGGTVNICQITRPASPDVMLVEVMQGKTVGIMVYWIPVHGAEGYIATTSDGQNCSSEYSFCSLLEVECGQNRSLRVVAHNSAGNSVPSNRINYVTYPCPPNNISVVEPTPGNCSLVWDTVPLADYYIAFIKRDDGQEESCNTTKTSCPFDCTCGHSFLVTVFPYNKAGTSPLSHVRNYTTTPCCPANVSVQLVSTETLEVTWLPVRGAELYETTARQTHNVIHCNDTAPVCALSDLRCDTSYSVTVKPCSESGGCNSTCQPHTQRTAPCSPEILNTTQTNANVYRVHISNPNSPNTNYTVCATGRLDKHTCHTTSGSCDLTQLPCGSTYEVTAMANTAVGKSLPGYSQTLETGPCCPSSVNVSMVTQAMTNVTWSPGHGARSYVTSLTSAKGHAKCHTMDDHCVMGCIVCSTDYNVTLEAISSTGHKSQCNYHGFSSSPCCPMGIKLNRNVNNTLRVSWRSMGPQYHNHSVELYGTGANYTCMAQAGRTHCDIQENGCGDVYTVVVAPMSRSGGKVTFCQARNFSVSCPGNFGGIFLGRRS